MTQGLPYSGRLANAFVGSNVLCYSPEGFHTLEHESLRDEVLRASKSFGNGSVCEPLFHRGHTQIEGCLLECASHCLSFGCSLDCREFDREIRMDWESIDRAVVLIAAASTIVVNVSRWLNKRRWKHKAAEMKADTPPTRFRLSFTVIVIWDVFAILLLGWLVTTSSGAVAFFAVAVLLLVIVLFAINVALQISLRRNQSL